MNKEKYLQDINTIKELMSISSRFASLSGLSGIFTGIFAIIGGVFYYINDIATQKNSIETAITCFCIVTLLSIVSTIFFTYKRTKLTNEKLWDTTSKALVKDLATTLIIGSLFILILLVKGEYRLATPLVPLVYGLSLIHASAKTSNILKPLGGLEICIAFLCLVFTKYSFWFYVLGFGVIHLVYGAVVYFKYDKK